MIFSILRYQISVCGICCIRFNFTILLLMKIHYIYMILNQSLQLMTKKSLLFLVLCICISIGAVSQVTQTNKIIKKTGLLTAGFYQNNQKLNWKSLNNVVANDQKATEILQSVKDQQMIGSALSLGGAGLMCVGAAVSFVNTIQNIQRLSAGHFPRT